ncbi:MAG TPA: M14 family metallopeptidase [Pyrinomonadaceae bacterium]|nr:M14 family metallopeptidase [Pyrinomonadaceae bacterium]
MSQAPLSPGWETHAEQTNYRETPNYQDTITYARRLADASPFIEYRSFGKSGQGRDLPLLIASESETLTPATAEAEGKAVVLIQACIHAGEPDGKDAGLALLRDIAISKTKAGLLNNVVLLFMPIYNPDGHERSSPFNRINQNGPAEMGWRTTSTYQNLNRDYIKADTPETRAWLALWNEWQPDLFIDCHVTDGADYRCNITYHHATHGGIDVDVLEWERNIFGGKVAPATEAAGNVISWYLEFIDNRDLKLGTRDFYGTPRFSTGYTPLRNRPGILIETHMIKDYRSRVVGTYDFLRLALEEVNRDPERLRSIGRVADEQMVEAGKTYDPARSYPLDFELTDAATPFQVRAFSYQTDRSDISGDVRVVYGTEPLDLTVPMYQTFRVKTAVAPPLCYIVPIQWQDVISLLQTHGLQTKTLSEALTIEVESYRFTNVRWPAGPFEGRHLPSYELESFKESKLFPAGSVLVPLAQPLARVALNLLEPGAPDSLAKWGFFNATFEQKEYGEPYVLEALAREMIDKDPSLRQEFERRLKTDSAFASSPSARLEFFYQRSPYWDQQMMVYPVARVTNLPDSVARLLVD